MGLLSGELCVESRWMLTLTTLSVLASVTRCDRDKGAEAKRRRKKSSDTLWWSLLLSCHRIGSQKTKFHARECPNSSFISCLIVSKFQSAKLILDIHKWRTYGRPTNSHRNAPLADLSTGTHFLAFLPRPAPKRPFLWATPLDTLVLEEGMGCLIRQKQTPLT